jgi:hypothetical protein
MFALLIPLVLNLAPQLAGMIFGSKGADATAKVAGVVQTVVGAVADLSAPGGVAAAVATFNPINKRPPTWRQNSQICTCRCRRSRTRKQKRSGRMRLTN